MDRRQACRSGQVTWAITVTERVNRTAGLPVGLWSQTFSSGVGILASKIYADQPGASTQLIYRRII
ncbi:MAG: hypothetical protein ACHQNA_09985 [Acidimicrobiales bacterium]